MARRSATIASVVNASLNFFVLVFILLFPPLGFYVLWLFATLAFCQSNYDLVFIFVSSFVGLPANRVGVRRQETPTSGAGGAPSGWRWRVVIWQAYKTAAAFQGIGLVSRI
jgi:hypothetical protein